MGGLSWIHWLLLALVALVLFGGRGKVSALMGDFGKGLKSFKKSMREDEPFEDEQPPSAAKPVLPPETARTADKTPERDRATQA